MAHMESIYKSEQAAELCKRGDLLASRGHLHEAMECVGEGLALHPASKDLKELRDRLTPLLDRLEEELEKAARRAAKRRQLKEKKKTDMKLQDAALVLGVAADCRDEAQLKKAYKKMSLKHHPRPQPGRPVRDATISKGPRRLRVLHGRLAGGWCFRSGPVGQVPVRPGQCHRGLQGSSGKEGD